VYNLYFVIAIWKAFLNAGLFLEEEIDLFLLI